MKKLMTVVLLACGLAACGGGTTVSGPENVPTSGTIEPVSGTASVPQPVAEPSEKQHVGTIAGATFSIQNNSGTFARYAARIYEVLAGGEQQLREEILSADVPAGQSWGGQFAKLPCNYQIDLDHYFVVVNPPAPGEIAHKIVVGNVCREPEPEPTPTPQPTPTPSPSPSPTPSPSPSPSPTPEPCEAPEFWDQSFTANKNEIKFNVHARGQGTWTLTLYATSSMSEYTNNDPDYTKDTDVEVVTKCKNGQTELKVDYDWRYHGSRYWWAVLRFNGVVKWKSAAVDHNLYD